MVKILLFTKRKTEERTGSGELRGEGLLNN